MSAYRRLARENWFQEQGWTGFIFHWNRGIGMGIYKLNWFNHMHDGIHLELVQTEELAEKKMANLELHLHREALGDLRDRMNELISPDLERLVGDLGDPFQFRASSSAGKISATFKCSPSAFAKIAAERIQQLNPVGQIIDNALNKLA